MYKDIDQYVKKCHICNKAGVALINTRNRVIYISHPNELWEIDLIGRIPDKNGNSEFIFVAIDHYTEWMQTKSAKLILQAVKELILDKHGIPKKILSDNGLEFKNEHTQNCAKNSISNGVSHHKDTMKQ